MPTATRRTAMAPDPGTGGSGGGGGGKVGPTSVVQSFKSEEKVALNQQFSI